MPTNATCSQVRHICHQTNRYRLVFSRTQLVINHILNRHDLTKRSRTPSTSTNDRCSRLRRQPYLLSQQQPTTSTDTTTRVKTTTTTATTPGSLQGPQFQETSCLTPTLPPNRCHYGTNVFIQIASPLELVHYPLSPLT